MRREADFFGEQELVLVFMARRLRVALALEKVLDAGGLDYAVVTGTYEGGLFFRTQRVGALFYVAPEEQPRARDLLREHGYVPL